MMGQTVGTKFVNVAGQVLLARLLLKRDFGLIASAYTISGIAGVIQYGGLREILIQRHAHVTRWANSAFWMGMLLSTVAGLVTIGLAPVASRMFHAPEVIGLLAVIAVSMPLSSLSVVQNALVQVELRFRLQAVLGFAALALQTALSVYFAWRNFGAYSFVLPLPIVAVFRWFILWLATRDTLRGALRWSPGLRRWRFLWMDNWLLIGFSVCSVITMNGDYFTLSVLHTKEVVGIYYFAFNLSTQTLQLVAISLAGVLFPALSKLRADPQRQLRAFMSAMRLLAFIGVPACFLQAALADPGMRLLFDPKWVPAIRVTQILSIGMAWLLYGWQAGALLQAQRRLGALFKYGIASIFIFLPLVYIGARVGQAVSVSIAVAIAFAVMAILAFALATIPAGASRKEVVGIFSVPMIFGAIAVGPVWLMTWLWSPQKHIGQIPCLALGTLIAFALYAWLLHRFVPDVWNDLRRSILRRRQPAERGFEVIAMESQPTNSEQIVEPPATEQKITPDQPKRPILHERPDYQPAYRHEEFIVPLLRDAIESCLKEYAKPAASGSRILDVGCGRQPFRRELQSFGYEYVSIDTQQNVDQSVDFICAIDAQLPEELLRRGPFQFLLCTEVMEHVADWDRAFKNFALLLAPGGKILITCPHVYPLHEVPYDFWRPTLYSLRYFARRVGLRAIFEKEAGDGWDVIGTAIGIAQPKGTGGLFSKFLAKMIHYGRWGVWLILKTRFIQKFVSLGPMYISNVVVYELPPVENVGALSVS